jgi:hypothetical protein
MKSIVPLRYAELAQSALYTNHTLNIYHHPVAVVLYKPYSQLTPLSGFAVQAGQS